MKDKILEKIIKIAKEDDRIRAAYIEGSRANKRVKADEYQDYDIGFVVEDTTPFINDERFIKDLGQVSYMQYPDRSPFLESDHKKSYGRLMQFKEGHRIDLAVKTKEAAFESMDMYKILVDKDQIFNHKIQDSDHMFWQEKPSQAEYSATLNEYWWCLNNIGKGIERNELPYVMDMLDTVLRPMVIRLFAYFVGAQNDFKVSIGKSGKYLKDYLDPKLYESYLSTYDKVDKDTLVKSVDRLCQIVDQVASETAHLLDLEYNKQEAENSWNHFKSVVNKK